MKLSEEFDTMKELGIVKGIVVKVVEGIVVRIVVGKFVGIIVE